MGPENFWSSGMWIFPLVMIIIMLFFMSRMFGRGGIKPPWMQDSSRERQVTEGPGSGGSESPEDILNKRYAKGEITKEEYDQMKSDLLG
ncbi:MAG: SHOCT domain-containing protein [Candidatus Neomarinimicrobiota bacterium]